MPRVGLTDTEVVRVGAEVADSAGLEALTLSGLAQRLGVKSPALYKHVDGIEDLRRRIATLAMTELGDALRDDLQGKAGREALAAFFATVLAYVEAHPGRYAATTGMPLGVQGDPLFAAATRVMDSVRAVLSGYGIAAADLDHAIRMLRCTVHGYAALSIADGFQWAGDPHDSAAWMIAFFDAGLARVAGEFDERVRLRRNS